MSGLESKSPEELIALIASLHKTTEELRTVIDRQHALIEELQSGTGSERRQRRMTKALNPNHSSEELGQRVELILSMAQSEAEGLREEARREAAALVEEAKRDAARIRAEAAGGDEDPALTP